MAPEEYGPELKALVIARLDAMKGEIEYMHKRGVDGWLVKVRTRNGSVFMRHDPDLVRGVEEVHADWVPCHAAELKEVVARAARFNVADVKQPEAEFNGIHDAPSDKLKLYAHFFNTLVSLEEKPTLHYSKREPVQWVLELSPGNHIEAPTLKKLCNRLDAYMHKHFIQQRKEILAAAKEAGLVEEPPEPEEIPEADVPVVVMPHSAPVETPQDTGTKVTMGFLAIAVGAALALGFMLGSVFG